VRDHRRAAKRQPNHHAPCVWQPPNQRCWCTAPACVPHVRV
jgi:hypothetical protein